MDEPQSQWSEARPDGLTGTSRRADRNNRRTGRRPGDSGTRQAILDAARQRFANHGYTGATIRDIAADAGVGPALVHHFYGTKERLFAAAMRLPVVPSEIIARVVRTGDNWTADDIGEKLIRVALEMWDIAEFRAPFLGLLRSALTNDRALTMFREFLTEIIIGTVAGALGAPDERVDAAEARYRASLVASQVLGLGLARYLFEIGPLSEANIDDLVAAVGPTLQRSLPGDVRRARTGKTPDATSRRASPGSRSPRTQGHVLGRVAR